MESDTPVADGLANSYIYIYIYIYINIYVCICNNIYICIYIQREREICNTIYKFSLGHDVSYALGGPLIESIQYG